MEGGASAFAQGHLFRFKLLPKGHQSPSWGLGSFASLGQRAMGNYIFLSTCEGQKAKLSEGWVVGARGTWT